MSFTSDTAMSLVLSPALPTPSGFLRLALGAGRETNGSAVLATIPRPSYPGGAMVMNNATLLSAFVIPYIQAHTLSLPTARYAYLLSMIVVAILLVWSLVIHHVAGGGVVAAAFRKVSIWRISTRGWKDANGRTSKWYSPTMGQMFSIYLLAGIAVCLSILGDNYIAPTSCTFWGLCDTGVVMRTTNAGPINHLLVSPTISISSNGWTTSARLGLIAYAMLPLTVTLALKQWPFNVWATPCLTNYGFDKTAVLHRWSGRIIWAFSTAHTVAWTIQLLQDQDLNSRPIFLDVWLYWKFVAGGVTYVVLTLLTLLSFNPIRSRFYELFYWSHIVLVVVFCVGCGIHAASRIMWPIAALAIWSLERLVRFGLLLYDNRIGTLRSSKPLKASRSDERQVTLPKDKVDWQEKHQGSLSRHRHHQYIHSTKRNSYYEFGPGQDTNYLGHHNRPHSTLPPYHHHIAPPTSATVLSRPGYALAQLLPGRTVRLTINAPGTLRWRPGQHLFLNIPGIAFFQSHPYTISNVDSRLIGTSPPSKGTQIVLIIRAQRGFSLKLWKRVVKQHSLRNKMDQKSSEDSTDGVELRAIVSRPFGSSVRTDWDQFESVLIVVGGTGISFGMGVLEYVCASMAMSSGVVGGEGSKTRRVRLVWIIREFAHLSWVAPALRRCLEISNPSQLQIDIFVTQGLPPPRPIDIPSTDSSFPTCIDSVGDADPSAQDAIDSVTELTIFDGELMDRTTSEVRVSSQVRREGSLRRAISQQGQARRRSIDDVPPISYPSLSRPSPSRTTPSVQQPLHTTFRSPLPTKDVEQSGNPDDDFLDLTPSDSDDLSVLAELALPGRPDLPRALDDEIVRSEGRVLVACCGPRVLNDRVRNLVSSRIGLRALRWGDQRGDVRLVCEDFSS